MKTSCQEKKYQTDVNNGHTGSEMTNVAWLPWSSARISEETIVAAIEMNAAWERSWKDEHCQALYVCSCRVIAGNVRFAHCNSDRAESSCESSVPESPFLTSSLTAVCAVLFSDTEPWNSDLRRLCVAANKKHKSISRYAEV